MQASDLPMVRLQICRAGMEIDIQIINSPLDGRSLCQRLQGCTGEGEEVAWLETAGRYAALVLVRISLREAHDMACSNLQIQQPKPCSDAISSNAKDNRDQLQLVAPRRRLQ